jgi:hypothetical protein
MKDIFENLGNWYDNELHLLIKEKGEDWFLTFYSEGSNYFYDEIEGLGFKTGEDLEARSNYLFEQSPRFNHICKTYFFELYGGAPELSFEDRTFSNLSKGRAFDYFKKHLVEKRYISLETLELFIKQAFELCKPPEEKYSFEGGPIKDEISLIFYGFYDLAGRPKGKRENYLCLLKDFFNGYENQHIKNFGRGYDPKTFKL